MISKTWTSWEQSHEYRTKMRGEWLRCCGRWCQRQHKDREGKGMILFVILLRLALSMGNCNIRPSQNRHPSTDHEKNCHSWLRRQPLRLCQLGAYTSTGCFWAYGWNITKIIFYLYLLFEERTYRSDTFTDFHARWLKRLGLMQGCAFLGIFHMAVHLKGQKPQFWGVNKRFQTKLAKSKNVHIFKTTASIPTKLYTVIKTTKCP